jgi:predicted phage terminase large subunit-like protein
MITLQKRSSIKRKAKELALRVASPALFAHHASEGKFRLPKHIKFWDKIARKACLGRGAEITIFQSPPRHGKTEYFSKWLPAWYAGRFPKQYIISTSYGMKLARKNSRIARELFRQHSQEYFFTSLSKHIKTAEEWETEEGGGLVASGTHGAIAGKGANLFIIDDYLKDSRDALSGTIKDDQWEWFQSTALTRLEPDANMIIVGTRWADDDLIGRIQRAIEEGNFDRTVEIYNLPALALDNDPLGRSPGEALWPSRYSRKRLEAIRDSSESYWFSSLFQGIPGKYGPAEFNPSYFTKDIWVKSMPDSSEVMAMAIDSSKGRDQKKGDYAAALIGGISGGKIYVSGLVERLPVSSLVDYIIESYDQLPLAGIGLEENANQYLIGEIAEERYRGIDNLPIIEINNSIDKTLRICRLEPYFRKDLFRFVDTPDMRLLINQLRDFPTAKFDDGPDALEMLTRVFNYLLGYIDDPSKDMPIKTETLVNDTYLTAA